MVKAFNDHMRWWQNTFPLDVEYRRKYHIPFGSKEHLRTTQIDILFDMCESVLFMDIIDEWEIEAKKEKLVEQGIWLNLKEQSTNGDSMEDMLFDEIPI